MAGETVEARHAQSGIAAMRRAADISLNITGSKQGEFKGGSKKKDRSNAIDVWDYSTQVVSPRDATTGQATGRRQHQPIVIYTEVEGGAVPMFHTALITNEQVSKWMLQCWRSDPKASKQVVYYTVELKNAVVSELEIFCDEDGRPNAKVSFTFDEITHTWKDGNITSTDTWHGTT